MSMEEKITYDEFVKSYGQPDNKFRFDLFDIRCKKCGSVKVEFNGELVDGGGYYGDSEVENRVIVKCHDCGNAFAMKDDICVSGGDYCGKCDG